MNTKNVLGLALVGALASTAVGSSSAHALDLVCPLREVGIHGGGTPDARVVARCAAPVNGIEWIAVPLSNAALSERFLDVATAAFLSGRQIYVDASEQGSGCFGNCRIPSIFVVWK